MAPAPTQSAGRAAIQQGSRSSASANAAPASCFCQSHTALPIPPTVLNRIAEPVRFVPR